MINPSWSFADVFALNALQKSMMFTPCWPSAGPTGGAGVALPAGICSLTIALTFFAIYLAPTFARGYQREAAPTHRVILGAAARRIRDPAWHPERRERSVPPTRWSRIS